MPSLAERLKRARETAGLTTRDLARRLGEECGVSASYGTVAKYERGESVPRADYLLAVCELCEVHPMWLLTEEGPREWEGTGGTDPYAEGMIDAAEAVLEGLRELPAFRRAFRLAPDAAEGWLDATSDFLHAVRETSGPSDGRAGTGARDAGGASGADGASGGSEAGEGAGDGNSGAAGDEGAGDGERF